ncbi:Mur ligase family protein [Thiocystis violacea]|uniref:Mur ligase family protein n=1 Tax=Thiocystis violacea TaxID=13725 RepID=UPI00190811D9|nr:UDP-N-acetylmuramoyl-L-alanyl-D-glutamate--2,6-diaminopimelate ligase [Thiocystis violacea]MBK1716475.1 UDP-N-acetylmuramoylalanyl-D-glutamate--2,6-diaminopimelate ligase [Thiocystis violacea]
MMALANAGPAWRLGDLLGGLVDLEPRRPPLEDRRISSLTLDSRTLAPGALFMARQGSRVHGLAFAEEVKRCGATAILAEIGESWSRTDIEYLNDRLGLPVIPVDGLGDRLSAIADRFHGVPSARLEVLGVAGAPGKATLGHLLAQALDTEQASALVGRLGIGFPDDLHAWPEAEQDPLRLQWTLDDLAGRGAKSVILELRSDPATRSRVAAVRFSHLVLANVTGGDPSALTAVVRDLALLPDSGRVVSSLDDPDSGAILAALPPTVSATVHSARPDARKPARCDFLLRATAIETLPLGLRLNLECVGEDDIEQASVDVGLIGRSSASNLLAVLAVLRSRGASLERAARVLSRLRGAPGRMECFGGEGAPLVVVDSARTPEAVERALTDLRLHARRRLFCVLGCGGREDVGRRPRLGAIAERLCDGLILTDDNPRGEPGEAIIADILAGVAAPEAVRVERQRGLAIRLAIALAGTGDAVLVAGKGHETLQDMGDLKVHFSDRAQVVEALREWQEGHH